MAGEPPGGGRAVGSPHPAGPDGSTPAQGRSARPVIADIRDSLARWNDPAARHARRERRASRGLGVWTVVALLCALASVVAVLNAAQVTVAAFLAMAGTIVSGALAVRSGARLRSLRASPARSAGAHAALPPAESAAYEPMRRLARAESSLAELLDQLPPGEPGSGEALPAGTVEGVRATAADAAQTLRELAARIVTVERARSAAPDSERAALDAAVRTLIEQLEDGLEGYGSLIAAAGRVVAATGTGQDATRQSLVEATDHLAGLAIALRELG
ncbi:hypothetical protein H0B56_11395 [Haloechinothrix sp. YIM 98757]|uniref:Uncharacterized protein n=1 Tax=Haloechinothrix aidingensis TaxID=2752311 RepID=A0A838A968_9PSEU|nr:hypothetical protein [Haloechinothrix aidingensis]MBA0126145.1 hypothetical protein [Haloechinothrix aidingensis]